MLSSSHLLQCIPMEFEYFYVKKEQENWRGLETVTYSNSV